MLIVIGIVIAFGLLLAYVRAVAWVRETQRTRFAFEDRDTYLYLWLDGPLGSGESAVVTMRTLREALRLKISGAGYERLLVEASGLRIASAQAFQLLIGALGPAMIDENVRLAVVCRRRTQAEKRFRESEILTPIPSIREGERYLRSTEPRIRVLLDPKQLDSLLVPGQRRAA